MTTQEQAAEILEQHPELTWTDLRRAIARMCEERGWHHGVPIMSSTDSSRSLVLAKGCPLSDIHGHDVPVNLVGGSSVHVCRSEDIDAYENGDCPEDVNYWIPSPRAYVVMRKRGKAKVGRVDLTEDRFNMFVRSLLCQAGAADSNAELTAMIALKGRINQNQWDAYILGNAFPETSKRSGVTYIFRKGRPTIAMRCRPCTDGQPGETRRFLAALCSHPLAWYQGTHVGSYPPSDEVLAHLLMMRADEHRYWRECNQHGLTEINAGI